MKIIPLSEGTFTVDKSKKFIPFTKGVDNLQDRPVGSLLVEIQPFCIVTQKDVLLIDTGLGFATASGKMQLHEKLLQNGIEPSSVTKVLMSHLHKDHSGGITTKHIESEKTTLSFPTATYYVHDKELFQHLDSLSGDYDEDEVNLLKSSENIVLYNEKGVIDDYIILS